MIYFVSRRWQRVERVARRARACRLGRRRRARLAAAASAARHGHSYEFSLKIVHLPIICINKCSVVALQHSCYAHTSGNRAGCSGEHCQRGRVALRRASGVPGPGWAGPARRAQEGAAPGSRAPRAALLHTAAAPRPRGVRRHEK